jgi:DNA-binding NtrC family response regulator
LYANLIKKRREQNSMPRILVIDDDVNLRELIRRFLERAGYEVLIAENGRVALEKQRQTPADLIITDIFMPGKEGTEIIMELNTEFPGTKIIVISGGGKIADIDFLKLAEDLGALKTFQKPFKQEELLAAVEELL